MGRHGNDISMPMDYPVNIQLALGDDHDCRYIACQFDPVELAQVVKIADVQRIIGAEGVGVNEAVRQVGDMLYPVHVGSTG